MSTEPKKSRPEPESDLLLDAPLLKAAVLIWTVGVFAIAIVFARAGLTTIGVLVLLAGAAIGIFAFWQPLMELYHWLRQQSREP